LIAALRNVCLGVAGRPWLRLALQAVVSLFLVGLLVVLARGGWVDSLASLRPEAVLLAGSLHALAFLLNSFRWQLLLGQVGIRERLPRLTVLYFNGLFFSQFLPTSAGGDAYRIYEVSRRGRPFLRVFFATLQERLLGLGVVMLIGLGATLYYDSLLPGSLWAAFVLVQAAGAFAVAALLWPGPLLALVARWRPVATPAWWKRLKDSPLGERLASAARTLRDLPGLGAGRCLLVVGLATAANLLGIAGYVVIGRSLGLGMPFSAYCLVVPLVWVVRMLPVLFNGIGVGEGAFVFLVGLFGVAADQALALALAMFGLQTALALVGGLLLAARVVRRRAPASGSPVIRMPLPQPPGQAQRAVEREAA
jgi:uncharacterized membrane protein YbhN (UPF0104 family)